MPVLASGKMDRRHIQECLETIDSSTLDSILDFQTAEASHLPAEGLYDFGDDATSTLAHQLRALWSEVLDIPENNISFQRPFLALGGDSISAMRVTGKARSQGLHFTVRDILYHSTIAGLAPHVQRMDQLQHPASTKIKSDQKHRYPLLVQGSQNVEGMLQKLSSKLKPPGVDEIEDIYPCSPSQEGMIVSQLRQPERKLYNFEVTWEVSAKPGSHVDLDRLEAACGAVIQRHPILRTVFCEVDASDSPFVQLVFETANSLGVPVVRSSLPPSDITVPTPIILDASRFPYQWTLCQTSDGVFCKFTMNHCVIDGSCLETLIHDIAIAYDNAQLPRAPLYSSFIGHLLENPLTESYNFWKAQLEDVNSCHFPNLTPSDRSTATSGLINVVFPENQVNKLRAICREQGLTVSTFMNTVWALVLQAYIGQDATSVCFGYMSSGRDIPVLGVEDIVGPLLSMLVQKVDLPASSTVVELLKNVQSDMLAGLPHQHCSLAKIQNSLGFQGETLFNTLVNVQRHVQPDEDGLKSAIKLNFHDYSGTAEFDVVFDVVDSAEGITANLLYWTSCISDEHARNLSATVIQVFEACLSTSDGQINQLELCSDQHRLKLFEWNPSFPPIR
ncbi:AMP-dependent synthetase/ligase [Penicillium cf. griseofulvum]|nr:AMP-dependent synthetase/ligase [Penicillium cf. griseofulvum]